MKRCTPVAVLALAAPAAAIAQPPTAHHKQQYLKLYRQAARKFGHRAPGRNIVRDGLSSGHSATDGVVLRSIAVLGRMLAPPPPVVHLVVPAPAPTTSTAAAPAAAPGSSLASCIIAHESGGNPQATNGQYAGIGQWSPTAWAQDGGTKYASSPLGASYSQQVAVLNGEGAAGMQAQQGNFDRCGG